MVWLSIKQTFHLHKKCLPNILKCAHQVLLSYDSCKIKLPPPPEALPTDSPGPTPTPPPLLWKLHKGSKGSWEHPWVGGWVGGGFSLPLWLQFSGLCSIPLGRLPNITVMVSLGGGERRCDRLFLSTEGTHSASNDFGGTRFILTITLALSDQAFSRQ